MQDNEEPEYTEAANVQIAIAGHKLPEQSRLPSCDIPRPFSFEHLIHQWQPMGVRVVFNIPFTGNDQDYLFCIRNGPFIPNLLRSYTDSSTDTTVTKTDKGFTWNYSQRSLGTLVSYTSYAFNNMMNVRHATELFSTIDPNDASIYITQYDQPPILSSLATMFRKWRGTMHYRLRVVSGFTTQGYIFSTLIRNVPAFPGIYPTNHTTTGLPKEDRSYREGMINSYVMGDTAMYRHFEMQVPFEYPVPYYDQFNWIGNRTRPAQLFVTGKTPDTGEVAKASFRAIRNEPHGDNYLAIGLRGQISSGFEKSQIAFELEYRAGDDFQFSDPFLPYHDMYRIPYADIYDNNQINKIQTPSKDYFTDGLTGFTPANKTLLSSAKLPPITRTPQNPNIQSQVINNRTVRKPRSLEGEDEVDLESLPGDDQDLLDLKRNMRKSLRDLNL